MAYEVTQFLNKIGEDAKTAKVVHEPLFKDDYKSGKSFREEGSFQIFYLSDKKQKDEEEDE